MAELGLADFCLCVEGECPALKEVSEAVPWGAVARVLVSALREGLPANVPRAPVPRALLDDVALAGELAVMSAALGDDVGRGGWESAAGAAVVAVEVGVLSFDGSLSVGALVEQLWGVSWSRSCCAEAMVEAGPLRVRRVAVPGRWVRGMWCCWCRRGWGLWRWGRLGWFCLRRRMAEKGWGLSGADVLGVRYLDWLDGERSSKMVRPVSAFLAEDDSWVAEFERADVVSVVRGLVDRGLVGGQRKQSGWLSFGGRLTPEGVRVVEERKRRRGSRRERAVAARDALLDWMYENISRDHGETPEIETFVTSSHALFEGDPFSADEVEEAAEFLFDEGFITGIRSGGYRVVARPRVTSKGKQAVETSRYTAEAVGSSGTVNQVTIGGNNYGQVGAGTVTQQQTNGVDPGTFAGLVSDLRAALDGLDEADRNFANRYVETFEREVSSPEPDHDMLEVAQTKLKRLADRVADAGVGVGVDALWAYVASRLGLPGA